MISVSLNGESREIPENLNIADLVGWLNLPADRVAVEHNLELVPRRLWAAITVQAGDRLEVVHFVGGGSAHCDQKAGLMEPRTRAHLAHFS